MGGAHARRRELTSIRMLTTEVEPFSARFRLLEELGVGTLGTVYRAHDADLDAQVALKVLNRADETWFAHLTHEFRIARSVEHENVVRLHEIGRHGDRCWMSMELIRGRPITDALRDAVARGDGKKFSGVVGQLTRALSELHRSGLVHRDVKPQNVLVDANDRVVLLDFDLAAGIDRRDVDVAGTPRYLAPEASWGELRPSADWYAVGIMLHEALGVDPRGSRRASSADVAAALPPGTDPQLGPWISSLVEPDPARRADGAAVGDVHPRIVTTPSFVGRRDELGRLRVALQRVGTRATFAVRGPAGIGKSALVHRLLETTPGPTVLRIAFSHGELFPLAILDALADSLDAALRGSPEDQLVNALRVRAAAAFPALRRRGDPRRSGTSGVPSELRGDAHRALAGLVRSLAERGTVWLVVDDAQWADPMSVDWLGDFLGAAPTSLQCVAAWREDVPFEGSWLARLASESMVLGPLDRSSAVELARGAGVAATDELRADPFSILHGASSLQVDGIGRRVAEIVSLAHAPVPRVAACRAADAGDDSLAVLVDLERKRIVRRDASTGRLVPYHDRIRQNLRADLDAELKRQLPGRLADSWSSVATSSNDVDAIVPHLRDAGRDDEARRMARSAADDARTSLHFEREATHLGWALDGASATDRGALLRRLASAWSDAGYLARAAAALDDARSVVPPGEKAEVELFAAEMWVRAGHVDSGADRLLTILASRGVRPPRSDGARIAGGAFRRMAFYLRPMVPSEPIPDLSDDEAMLDLLHRAGNSLSMSKIALGYELMGRFLQRALLSPSREHLVRALGSEAVFAAAIGGPWLEGRAAAWLDAVERISEHGTPLVRAGNLSYQSVAAWELARWRACIDRFRSFEDLVRRDLHGRAWELRVGGAFAASAAFFMGDVDQLRSIVRVELDAAVDRGDPMARLHLGLGDPGLLALFDDDVSSARTALAAAEKLPVGADIETYYRTMLEANVLLYEGAGTDALRLLDSREPLLTRGGVLGSQIPRAWYTFTQARAVVASDRGARDRANIRRLTKLRGQLAARDTCAHRAFRAHVDAWVATDATVAGCRAAAAAAYRDAEMRAFAWAIDGNARPNGIAAAERAARWLDPITRS